MAICNGYPDISIVPPVGLCCSDSAFFAISKLPTSYPQVLSAENLQEAYSYTASDFELTDEDWYVFLYTVNSEEISEKGTVASTCHTAPEGAEDSENYYSYYNTVISLQGNRSWIVNPLTCEEPSKGIVKGPAALIIQDMSILPSPTVTPAPTTQIKINNPWHNVLRASANNILFSKPPSGSCRSGKWKLVYNKNIFPEILWECEDDEDDGSDYPTPSGSSGKAYCQNLSIDLKLIHMTDPMTVDEVNKVGYSGLCFLYITYSWRGKERFNGAELIIDANSYPTSLKSICPKVYATLSKGVNGDTRVRTSLEPITPIDPPNVVIRKKEIYQPVWLLALPCEATNTIPDYAPCCENRADNGIEDTFVEFTVSVPKCDIAQKTVFKVTCNEDDGEEEPQGTYVADLFFRNDVENITYIPMSECGEPITGEAKVYLCAEIRVTQGKFCSCNIEESINLSASGVEVAGSSSFHIPKGVYPENTVIPLSVPVTIKGNGKACNGRVTAQAFGITAELEINGEDCPCEDIPDLGFTIKGSKYIEVIPDPDSSGKVTYTIALKEDMLKECEK